MGHDIEISSSDAEAPVFSGLSGEEKGRAMERARAILRVELAAWERYFEGLEVQAMMSRNRADLEAAIDQVKWQVKRQCKRLALRKVASEMYKEKIHEREKRGYEDSRR